MSASTRAVSPTTRVWYDTILPLTRPSTRKVLRSRSSPRSSVPSSRTPFRSSATSPLIFIMAPRPRVARRRRGSEGAATAPRADQQLVEAAELGLAHEAQSQHASLSAPHDLDARAEGAAQPFLRRAGVGVFPGRMARSRRAQERDALLHFAHGQAAARGLRGERDLVFGPFEPKEGA